MAISERIYNFRILLETVNGGKTSYYSSSFVDLSQNLVLSASQVYDRITGSYSCSYVNSSLTSSATTFDVISGSNNHFKDSKLLSASLSGSFSSPNPDTDNPITNNEITGALDTGSIIFTALDSKYDRLLRYKFFGDKICHSLGIPSEQWIYVDQLRLPADKESNYVEGNVKSKNIFVSDTFTFANTSNINSNIPILIRTSSANDSDRFIKFVEIDGTPRNALLFGYDASASKYELRGHEDDDVIFNIKEVDFITASSGIRSENVIEGKIGHFGSLVDPLLQFHLLDSKKLVIPDAGFIGVVGDAANNIATSTDTSNIKFNKGNMQIRTGDSSDVRMIISGTNASGHVAIGSDLDDDDILTETLTVQGSISASGNLYVDGAMTVVGAITSSIVSSSILFSSGSNIFGDADTDQHTFNGSISASSNVRVTGDISASGDLYVVDDIFIGDRLEHIGDSNTHIAFTTDDIAITAGGVNVISTQTNGLDITLGTDGGNELELVLDNSNNRLLVKGDDNKIGLGNEVPTKKLTVEGAISASGDIFTEGTVSASNFYLTASGTTVVQVGFTGDSNIGKWEWHRNGTRKYLNYLEGRDNQVCPQDSLVFKHGVAADGNDHINFHMQPDDQTVYFHGGISSSGIFNLRESASIGVTTTGVGAGTTIPNKGLYVSGSVSGSITSTSSFGMGYFKNKLGVGTIAPDYDLDVAGTVGVANYIYHNGDEDTHILMEDNMINLVAGGQSVIKLDWGNSNDKIQINNTNANIDLEVMADDGEVILKTDATNNRVGINTTTPTKALQVTGDISASGDLVLGDLGNGTYISASQGNLEISGSGAGLLQIEGDISSSGIFNLQESASIGVTTTGAGGAGTKIPNKGLFVSGSISGSATSTGSFGAAHIMGNVGIGTTDDSGKELTVVGDISASGNMVVGSQGGANNTLRIGHATGGDLIGAGATSGSQLLISAEAKASSSIKFLNSNKYWEIAHSKSATGMIANSLHFRLNGTDKHVFDGNNGRVGIFNTAPTKELTVEGNISASGEVYAVSASFGSLTNATNRWTDGYHGNDDFIPILPTDFAISDNSSRGHAVYTVDGGYTIPLATDDMFAAKIIPKGFTAVSGSLYGNDVSNPVIWYSSSLVDTAAATVSTDIIEGGGGTGSAFTTAVVGDGSTYVICEWNPGASDRISGGKIYIKRT